MSTCDTCRAPGSCCKNFVLVGQRVDSADWHNQAMQILAKHNLPFVPVRKANLVDNYRTEVLFSCTKVNDSGRCMIYEERPQLCRDYQAGSDRLCIEHVMTFRGIPIHVEAA